MALPLSYNIRNIAVRWQVTALAVGGIALVVAVLLVLTAMANGFRVALRATGSTQNAIVTQRGSTAELTSGMSRDTANTILVDSRVARDGQGRPLASPEIVLVASLPRRGATDAAEVNVTVRGVSPMAFQVRQGLKIVQGRQFTPGLYELVVGKQAAERYEGAQIGSTIKLQRRSWQVVGIFSSEGSGFESEVWGDVDAMGGAFNRSNGYQSLTLRLKDPSGAARFDAELQKNPAMQVQLQGERDFYEKQAGQTATTLTILAVFVGVVMGIGAIFGAMNTMYGLVASRTREIGTLRALGFSRLSIMAAFIIESAVLALIAGVVGCLLALPVNLLSGATGGANFSQVAFAFRISGLWLVVAIIAAVCMGVFGGMLPSFRAARTPITAALRDA
ncbi:MAG TPA: ABC transporter permease [Vicinamibacterales bacterium]|nr:ABC transporter permease [Vicinamibacterales bacterium]